MRQGWAALASAAGGVLLLVSLYLPWWSFSADGFVGSVDGWGAGEASAAAALAALGAAAGWLAARERVLLPLALLAAYLVVAVAVLTRFVHGSDYRVHFRYGLVVGFAAFVLLLVGVADAASPPRGWPRSSVEIGLGALVALAVLLPFARVVFRAPPTRYVQIGAASAPALAAGVLGLVAVMVAWQGDPAAAPRRVGVAVATAVMAGAVMSGFGDAHRLAAAWILLGAAAGLTVVALPALGPVRSPLVFVTAGAAGLLIAALFLPWARYCPPGGMGPGLGACDSGNGWTLLGTVTAILALALVVLAVDTGALDGLGREAASAIGLLVAVKGFDAFHARFTTVGVGAWLGCAAAGALAAVAFARASAPALDRARVLELVAPVATALVYLAATVLPWLDVLPPFSTLGLAGLSLLTVAGALLAVALVGAWIRGRPEWLVAIPLALLAIASLGVIAGLKRERNVTWGEGIVVALCLILAGLGRIEQRRGLRRFELPEILRIDRI